MYNAWCSLITCNRQLKQLEGNWCRQFYDASSCCSMFVYEWTSQATSLVTRSALILGVFKIYKKITSRFLKLPAESICKSYILICYALSSTYIANNPPTIEALSLSFTSNSLDQLWLVEIFTFILFYQYQSINIFLFF